MELCRFWKISIIWLFSQPPTGSSSQDYRSPKIQEEASEHRTGQNRVGIATDRHFTLSGTVAIGPRIWQAIYQGDLLATASRPDASGAPCSGVAGLGDPYFLICPVRRRSELGRTARLAAPQLGSGFTPDGAAQPTTDHHCRLRPTKCSKLPLARFSLNHSATKSEAEDWACPITPVPTRGPCGVVSA